MPVSPRELIFASLYAYSPRDESEEASRSRRLRYQLKRDGFTRTTPPRIVSEWLAAEVRKRLVSLPFARFFGSDVVLVPMPTHAKRDPGALWVPMRLCEALYREGLAGAVLPCVLRVTPVAKAALARSEERPSVEQHLASFSINDPLAVPKDIVLVDDVVTRGATFMAASIKIHEVNPAVRIRAFSILRTISDPDRFERVDAPCVGAIRLYESGKTHRAP